MGTMSAWWVPSERCDLLEFYFLICLVKLARDITRVFTPKWCFFVREMEIPLFQGNLGW